MEIKGGVAGTHIELLLVYGCTSGCYCQNNLLPYVDYYQTYWMSQSTSDLGLLLRVDIIAA